MASVKPIPGPDFQKLFESTPGMYVVLAPDFRIVAATDEYLRGTLRQREHILGRSLFYIFSMTHEMASEGVQNLRQSLNRVLQNCQLDSLPFRAYSLTRPISTGDGAEERCWKITNSPVFGLDHQVIYIMHGVEDMTETSRLAGAVAHDFNNVLGVILACEQMLAEQPSNPELTRRLLVQMKQAAEKAATLSKRLVPSNPTRML